MVGQQLPGIQFPRKNEEVELVEKLELSLRITPSVLWTAAQLRTNLIIKGNWKTVKLSSS